MGYDLNRHWQEPSPWSHPTLYATKNLLMEMDTSDVCYIHRIHSVKHVSSTKFKLFKITRWKSKYVYKSVLNMFRVIVSLQSTWSLHVLYLYKTELHYAAFILIINSKSIIVYRNLISISMLTFTLIQLLWMDSCMEISMKIRVAMNARQSFQNSSGRTQKIFRWPTHRLTEMQSRQELAEGSSTNLGQRFLFIVYVVGLLC